MNFARNLRKEIEQLLQVWVDESSNALLARWLIERNLATDATAICANDVSGSSDPNELTGHQSRVACGPQGAPKPPSHAVRHGGAAANSASDKIFGEEPFPRTPIHIAS
jgi:hypothetical protein